MPLTWSQLLMASVRCAIACHALDALVQKACGKRKPERRGSLDPSCIGVTILQLLRPPIMTLHQQICTPCQEMIEELISIAHPSHSVLGEESVPPGIDAAMSALAERQQVRKYAGTADAIS